MALGDEGAKPDNVARSKVVVAGGRTTRVTLVVAPGQHIQFENHDPFPHTLYDVGEQGLQATETAAPAKQRAWTPPGPGEIRRDPRQELAERALVDRGRAEGRRDRVPVQPHGRLRARARAGARYKLRGYFNGEAVGERAPDLDVKPKPN